MNRRTFLCSSISATLAARFSWAAGEGKHLGTIGVQLYTVRDAMQSDFAGTLAKVAAIGYKEVEFAGLFDHSPKEVRELLDHNGLTSPSCHVDYEIVQNKWPETLDAAHTLGQKFIVCPWIEESQRKQPDGWKRAAELFNHAGEASQKAGIQFAYHNHDFDFRPDSSLGGRLPYDYLLAETDPKFVKMEMDLCWITVGGQDPVKYFNKYPGRFPLVHVKDWKGQGGTMDDLAQRMADVGSGSIDWKRIFANSSKAGIQHYFVEHDSPASPFDSLRASYAYLRNLNF